MIEINNSLKFEYQLCICGYDATNVVTSKTRHDDFLPIVRCPECSTLFMKFYPDTASLNNYYKNIYRVVKHNNETPEKLFQRQIERGEKAFRKFKKTAFFSSGGKLLDHGGAAGGVSYPFKAEYETYVFDLDPIFTSYARTQGHNIVGDVELEQRGHLYDVIILSHVIEHVPHPEQFLEKLKLSLTENGVLMIATTFIETSLRRHNLVSFIKDVHLAHKFYFSYNTLSTLLLRINMVPSASFDDWIVYSKSTDKSFKKSNLAAFYDSPLIYSLAKFKFGIPSVLRRLIRNVLN